MSQTIRGLTAATILALSYAGLVDGAGTDGVATGLPRRLARQCDCGLSHTGQRSTALFSPGVSGSPPPGADPRCVRVGRSAIEARPSNPAHRAGREPQVPGGDTGFWLCGSSATNQGAVDGALDLAHGIFGASLSAAAAARRGTHARFVVRKPRSKLRRNALIAISATSDAAQRPCCAARRRVRHRRRNRPRTVQRRRRQRPRGGAVRGQTPRRRAEEVYWTRYDGVVSRLPRRPSVRMRARTCQIGSEPCHQRHRGIVRSRPGRACRPESRAHSAPHGGAARRRLGRTVARLHGRRQPYRVRRQDRRLRGLPDRDDRRRWQRLPMRDLRSRRAG